MSLIYNDYQKIKQENADAIAEISCDNKGTVLKMFRYISAFQVSLFELEVIKKDIIGIALEADAEKKTLEEKLGVSEKEFCDSLFSEEKSSGQCGKWMIRVRNFFLDLAAIQSLEMLIMGCSNNWGIQGGSIVLALFCAIMSDVIEQYSNKHTSYRDKKEIRKIKGIVSILILLGYFFVFFVPIPWMIFENHGRLAWLVLLIITLIVYLLNSAYWNHCSKQYDWK